MAKYLIEDIIPPEKKHRAPAKKKTGAGRSVHIEKEERPAPEIKKTISEAYPENPREILVDQMKNAAPLEQTAESTPAPKETPREEAAPALGMGTWSNDLSVKGEAPATETSAHFPPQFPEYGRKDGVYDEGRGGMRSWLPWLIGVAVVIVVGWFSLGFFAGATVTVVPKHEQLPLPLDQKFTAVKTETTGKLAYAIMIETASSSAEVPATGEKSVTTKASGQIVIFNEQTTAQRLIKNTRFQAPSGKIYRISDSITIPKSTVLNGAIKPGSLEVTVYADEAGPEYNSPPVDFTVPGLKNSKIYEKVYARSKGPLAGGASGVVKTVSDQDLKNAGDDLRIQLETKLRAKARGNLATSQIAYDKGIVVTLQPPKLVSTPASADNKAVVSAEGSIAVVTFKRADLTRAIVAVLAPESVADPVEVKNLDTLNFAMEAQKNDALLAGSSINFTLQGTPELYWTVDEAVVKAALLGLPKARFDEKISQYSSVQKARASIRPLWRMSFPEDPEKISIVLVDSLPNR
ncbi:MAG: hypothetical protein A3C93_02945 [Candidatus Lloydbacteria bacterium RIFCSPHIGHO2_02_FULL_54_17]|uniref:Baseplate protein J-like domain-containing protein n=1 Tax=Candidatus Lloydbacteria bacterium RIFCSPHIGHO2_02_FULL_54_17 TaxID=1798664 RepID=A0A1G2DAH2_9BACT|nr:MAG: hypothetical protein A2762_04815 [Candidatus Lloydbacteria bacterium RIFCSPHIGHO2_01_FULL_54_11]OGZ10627.1 MAG: hypothetical protein A3C93_02945 [Candidatus Lloydbacteria bacterium RIFCSPHIGHO2_02_FULL_54_17]OGZ13662.1 MAG: hypothetical protein A2948_03135 [Candidatus Lloydbacteria bacterium RIFCSPLOWO2_01_FULL_54_18]OGZ16098.1 MAG: hypothetical protein A3H76_01590 [Candidatus Lloydbacteria bacterium RIFCSPLOWO2_02_FULL_54_12]